MSPYESVVGSWAHIKELAAMNMGEEGVKSIRLYVKGNNIVSANKS